MNLQASDAPHALVVDDDFVIRMHAMDIFEQAGFRVVEAEHGDAAFILPTMRHPEIILLFTDVQMPGQLEASAD